MIGLGTLGLCGKYRFLTESEVLAVLDSLDATAFSFVDSASVYRDLCVDVFQILTDLERWASKPVVYKIGAEVRDGDIRKLCGEVEVALNINSNLHLMLHRAGEDLLDAHARFFGIIAKDYGFQSISISTNSIDVLEKYSGAIPISAVQCAFNLLDYRKNIGLVQRAQRLGIKVQARSVLGTGLLSGKYDQSHLELFRDDNRRRYRETDEAKKVYLDRIKKVQLIADYYRSLLADKRYSGSFAQFCISAVACLPEISAVVVGGSTLSELVENATCARLPTDVVANVRVLAETQWSASVL